MHDWQCDWHLDQYPWECTCGLTAPRQPWMDYWPKDRAPTEAEIEEGWRRMREDEQAQESE